MKQKRIQILLFAVLALTALVLLAAGISQVTLSPGIPFMQLWAFLVDEFAVGMPAPPAGYGVPGGETMLNIFRIFFTICLVCFPIAVILTLISPELRKRVLKSALRVLLLMIAIFMLMESQAQQLEIEPEPVGKALEESPEMGMAERPDFGEFDPQTNPWLVWGLSLGLGLLLAYIVYSVYRLLRPEPEEEVLVRVAREAEAAVATLEQGGDLRDTIMRCYAEMMRLVREQRGLRRQAAVTASEFVEYLEDIGMPPDAVERLTHLFEEARYATHEQTAAQERQAISSLQAIVQACQRSA